MRSLILRCCFGQAAACCLESWWSGSGSEAPGAGLLVLDGGRVQAAQDAVFAGWQGGPGQDVVIAADIVDEMHRLAAAGKAITGLTVPLFLGQPRQD